MKRENEYTALPLPDLTLVGKEYAEAISDVFDLWRFVRPRNLALSSFYTMHNSFVDLGVAELPQGLKNTTEVVGWAKKAVDVMAVRSKFDGFVFSGQSDAGIDNLVRINRLRSKYARACKSSLIHGISFFTVMADKELGARVRTFSANQACCIWDSAKEQISTGVVVSKVDKHGRAMRYIVHTPDAVITFDRASEKDVTKWAATVDTHFYGRPLMEPLVYDADNDRVLGHSRITPEVISIINKAMRDVLNMDIAAAFWTFPQRYFLGLEPGSFADDYISEDSEDSEGAEFKLKTRMETYLGHMLTISRDENGDVPQVGQFQPLDVGNLIQAFENDAQRFSGATHVPLAQLGVLGNTYTSSDALGAANDPLILDVEAMNTQNSEAMAEVGRMMLCVSSGKRADELTDAQKSIQAYFQDPSMPTIAARADGWTKIASADKALIGTRVWYEGLGMKQATIDRVLSEKTKTSAIDALNQITQAQK